MNGSGCQIPTFAVSPIRIERAGLPVARSALHAVPTIARYSDGWSSSLPRCQGFSQERSLGSFQMLQ